MKKAILVHGWEGHDKEPLFLWLKQKLEEEGFAVVYPQMPDTEEPKIETWLGKLKEVAPNPDKDTVFVGHSVGCQAVLRYVESLPEKATIGGIVLIAPWMELDMTTIEEEGEDVVAIARPWMETPIDFEKVKACAKKITAIFSDNDPYVPFEQKEIFKEKLDADIIVEHDKQHFSQGDGITELPSALNAVLKLSK